MRRNLRDRIAGLSTGEARAVMDVLDHVVELIWDVHADAIFDAIVAEAQREPPERIDDDLPF